MALKGLRRQRERAGVPFVGSLVLHALLLAGAWATSKYRPAPMVFESYAIELYSPPPAVQADEFISGSQELVVERPPEMPDPAPPAPKPEDEAPVRTEPPKPEPKPAAPTPSTPAPAPTDAPRRPAAGPDAVPGSPGGENLNIRMEGLRRDYPQYYANIVTQISRCFNQQLTRPITGPYETVVDFAILRDGKVPEETVRVFKASGSVSFDDMAQGAIECASSRFQPLPEDLPWDRLPIRFKFTPAGAGGH
jgi:outer membrane biosynthesis protein TonB